MLRLIRDYFILQVGRNFFVTFERRHVTASALRHTSQFGCVFKDFRLRRFRGDNGFSVYGIRSENTTSAFVHVAHYVAHIVIGNGYFHSHYRFENTRRSLFHSVLIGEFRGGNERHFLAVYGVRTSVEKRAFKVYHGVSRKNALFDRFAKSFIDRGNKLFGNDAADYRVNEFVFAVLRAGGRAVTSVGSVAEGEQVEIEVSDGKINATVNSGKIWQKKK